MALIRRVIQVGDSRAVTIPKTWLAYCESKSGQRIREVAMEINGKLTIWPILRDMPEQSKPNGKDIKYESCSGH